jgi:hypothetical protein
MELIMPAIACGDRKLYNLGFHGVQPQPKRLQQLRQACQNFLCLGSTGARNFVVVVPTIALRGWNFESFVNAREHDFSQEQRDIVANRNTLANLPLKVHQALVDLPA